MSIFKKTLAAFVQAVQEEGGQNQTPQPVVPSVVSAVSGEASTPTEVGSKPVIEEKKTPAVKPPAPLGQQMLDELRIQHVSMRTQAKIQSFLLLAILLAIVW